VKKSRADYQRRVYQVAVLVIVLAAGWYIRANSKGLLDSRISKVVVLQKAAVKTPRKKTISITAAGDVMFDRRVKAATIANKESWPFAQVASYFKATDLTVANLESPLSSTGKATPEKDVVFQGTLLGAKALKQGGIDVVSLANNHALDYGLGSLQQTTELLDKEKIGYAGAGASKQEAFEPAILKVGDLLVGFLSFSDVIPFNSFPSKTAPGIAPARDKKTVSLLIKALSKEVHLVIVTFHWGVEYKDYPTGRQKELAVAAIDAGADLVLGTHPHVTQGIAVYKKRLIFYSLGNFLFDHYKPRTGESILPQIDMNYKGEFSRARIWPVLINDSGQPSIAAGSEGQRILSRLKTISGKYAPLLQDEGDSLTLIR